MRQLMAELLFDRPFNLEERSNTCNPQLTTKVERIRSDPEILTRLAELKRAFLHQDDCLCHGDLATDNVMVTGEQFRVRTTIRYVFLQLSVLHTASYGVVGRYV